MSPKLRYNMPVLFAQSPNSLLAIGHLERIESTGCETAEYTLDCDHFNHMVKKLWRACCFTFYILN